MFFERQISYSLDPNHPRGKLPNVDHDARSRNRAEPNRPTTFITPLLQRFHGNFFLNFHCLSWPGALNIG